MARQVQDSAESSVGTDSWADPTRRRWELAAVLAFCLATFVVPLVFCELYPFSAQTMFAREVHEIVAYEVKAPDGRRLSTLPFGLQLNNPDDDPPLRNFGRVGYGRHAPPSLQGYDLVATQEEVTSQVQARLRAYPQLRFVYVNQVVVGAIDATRVGIIKVSPWLILNPHYGRSER